jgi:hypothetical protein
VEEDWRGRTLDTDQEEQDAWWCSHERAGEVARGLRLHFERDYDPDRLAADVVAFGGPLRGRPDSHCNASFSLLGAQHALVVGLADPAPPQEALANLVRRGGDADTVGAIAGALLGARYGEGWIPAERLQSAERLLTYADALVARPGYAVEDPSTFGLRERALTDAEAAYQAHAVSGLEDPDIWEILGDGPEAS